MNPEIKALWVEALRSGEYTQGHGTLYDGEKHCCLGVLCEVHRKQKRRWRWKHDEEGGFRRHPHTGESLVLPDEVQKWAGLETPDPKIEKHKLSSWNDGSFDVDSQTTKDQKNFDQIADMIERNL